MSNTDGKFLVFESEHEAKRFQGSLAAPIKVEERRARMSEVELSERAQELLDDLLSFTEKDRDELIDEALVLLTHHYNGTDPGEQWGSNG